MALKELGKLNVATATFTEVTAEMAEHVKRFALLMPNSNCNTIPEYILYTENDANHEKAPAELKEAIDKAQADGFDWLYICLE